MARRADIWIDAAVVDVRESERVSMLRSWFAGATEISIRRGMHHCADSKLWPSKLVRGAAPMASRTANFTLSNLAFNAFPRIAAAGEEADHRTLQCFIEVIELEHKRIGLAAVNAGMLQQELPKTARPTPPALTNQPCIPCNVRLAIEAIVLASVRNEALAAYRLTLACGPVAEIEVFLSFQRTAPPADSKASRSGGSVRNGLGHTRPRQHAQLREVRS